MCRWVDSSIGGNHFVGSPLCQAPEVESNARPDRQSFCGSQLCECPPCRTSQVCPRLSPLKGTGQLMPQCLVRCPTEPVPKASPPKLMPPESSLWDLVPLLALLPGRVCQDPTPCAPPASAHDLAHFGFLRIETWVTTRVYHRPKPHLGRAMGRRPRKAFRRP